MKTKLRKGGGLAALVLLMAGCTTTGGTFHVTKTLGDTDTLLTSADLRLLTSTPVAFQPKEGRIIPRRVVCAEPSPDVVKAVQQSFGLGASLGVDIPAQAAGQAAVSIAKARAEAAAQLGERLATIQLLRDGLFRACEAYANGALSEVSYAILLSRYDDTMISMLMGELAAGNFGRQLTTLGGSTSTSATGEGELQSTLAMAKAAREAAVKRDKELSEAEKELQNKEEELAEAKKADPEGDHSQQQKAVEDARRNVDEKKTQALIANKAVANASATATAVAAGAINRTPNEKIGRLLHEMQRKYIENINADALVVACITALSRDQAGKPSALSAFCGAKNGIIEKVVKGHHELLMALKHRADLARAAKVLDAAISNIEAIKMSLGRLIVDEQRAAPESERRIDRTGDSQ